LNGSYWQSTSGKSFKIRHGIGKMSLKESARASKEKWIIGDLDFKGPDLHITVHQKVASDRLLLVAFLYEMLSEASRKFESPTVFFLFFPA
jgi:hypothetical protein